MRVFVAGAAGAIGQQLLPQLAARGHKVLVLAPAQSAELIRSSRRAIRTDPDALVKEAAAGKPLVLAVGVVLPFSFARRRAASLPVDVARTLEELLGSVALDIVHVHEPFQPSAASTALRHSRALNVGSFHAPTERILSTQLTRPLTRLLFSRLDVRIASYRSTAELMQQFFPAEYRVLLPGATPVVREREPHEGVELLLVASEERGAVRVFLRALRSLQRIPGWHATIYSARPLAAPATLSHTLRERVRFVDSSELTEGQALAHAETMLFINHG